MSRQTQTATGTNSARIPLLCAYCYYLDKQRLPRYPLPVALANLDYITPHLGHYNTESPNHATTFENLWKVSYRPMARSSPAHLGHSWVVSGGNDSGEEWNRDGNISLTDSEPELPQTNNARPHTSARNPLSPAREPEFIMPSAESIHSTARRSTPSSSPRNTQTRRRPQPQSPTSNLTYPIIPHPTSPSSSLRASSSFMTASPRRRAF